jgi:isopenicillin N synthase-like dioxygenase
MQVKTVDYRAADAAETLERSLRDTGFAVLANHPITPERIDAVYGAWGRFFAGDDKFGYAVKPPAHDGYFAFRSENAKDSATKDLKEFFHVYPGCQLPDELDDLTRQVYADLETLGRELLGWIEGRAPASITDNLSMPLGDMMEGSDQSLLRILHYPPVEDAEPGAIRAAAHEDINLITLLLSGSRPGLQARDADGGWHDIACDPGMITINNGDMLAMATDNYFPSTTHRVTNPDTGQNVSRYSMPMFLHPRPDAPLRPDLTADQYLQRRLKEIGLK